MSSPSPPSLLSRVLRANAFDGTPPDVDLAALHVSRDDGHTEQRLRDALLSGERIGICGAIGSGKTSLLRSVLDDPEVDVIPIVVDVTRDDNEIATEPVRFLRHVLGSAIRTAARAEQVTQDERLALERASTHRRPLGTITTRGGLKAGFRAWFNTEISGEISRALDYESLERSHEELTQLLDEVVAILGSGNARPVIAIDDSDAFTRTGPQERQLELVEQFFGRTLQSLAQSNASVVVAIHDGDRVLEEFRRARQSYGAFGQVLDLPTLPSDLLPAVLRRRIGAYLELNDVDLDAIFAPESLHRLQKVLTSPSNATNLRTTLHVAHAAGHHAHDDDRDRITDLDVDVAARQYSLEDLG